MARSGPEVAPGKPIRSPIHQGEVPAAQAQNGVLTLVTSPTAYRGTAGDGAGVGARARVLTSSPTAPREPQTPLNLWNTPEKPWDRLHIDFTGSFEGQYWFVVIDAFSRWLEIFPMSHANANNTIQVLRSLFFRFGVPRQIVSDNGSQFTSSEFKKYCSDNSIKLVFTTPYHSRSNGLVERAIRTFKWRISKTSTETPDRLLRLQQMLFTYRITEHSTTGRTPAELFLGRRINSTLDLLKPSVCGTIDQHQFMMKYNKDRHTANREFSSNDPIYVRRPVDQIWSSAVISQRTSPLSYTTTSGHRVHADHLKSRMSNEPQLRLQLHQWFYHLCLHLCSFS